MGMALVLIDIQNDYFPGGHMELADSMDAAAAAARLLNAFRRASLPLFHVQHVSTRPGSTFFLPNTPGVAFYWSVASRLGEPVVIKHFPNSFRETGLLEQLRAARVRKLLFCGMMTHMCVDATVRAAFDLGFDCTVAGDACATRDLIFNAATIPAPQVQGAFLAALGAGYAEITTADAVIENIPSGKC